MIEPIAHDFAQTSLLDHAAEGTFTVALCGDAEGNDVADAFRLLGCTVVPEPFDLALKVTAPHKA